MSVGLAGQAHAEQDRRHQRCGDTRRDQDRSPPSTAAVRLGRRRAGFEWSQPIGRGAGLLRPPLELTMPVPARIVENRVCGDRRRRWSEPPEQP